MSISERMCQERPEKPFRAYFIWKKVLQLLSNPEPGGAIKIGKFNGHKILRADCGEFRIIYYFDDKFLWILLIGKRNDDQVYREFDRKMQSGGGR